jgi:hypothetical protein
MVVLIFGASEFQFSQCRHFHADAGDCPFGDLLKYNAGSPSFSPHHTTLFLCACPKQLKPVWQDGQSKNFQARPPGA